MKFNKTRIITLAIIFAILLLMAIIPPSWFQQNYTIPCYHEQIIGIQCPLCGLTSATYNLVHFNFVRATELNFVVLPLSLLVFAELLLIFKHNTTLLFTRKLLLIATIIGFIAIYAIRIANAF